MLDVLAREAAPQPFADCWPTNPGLPGDFNPQPMEPPGKCFSLGLRPERERDTVGVELFRSEHAANISTNISSCQEKSVTLPEAIKEMRKRLRWRQIDLAKAIPASHQAVATWEQAKNNPLLIHLERLLDLAEERGFGDLAFVFALQAGHERSSVMPLPSQRQEARPEQQLSPTSKEFNRTALVSALDSVLKLPEAMRDLVIPQLVRVARDFAHWNPEDVPSEEDAVPVLRFPDIVIRTKGKWPEGTEDRLSQMNPVAVLVDPLAAGEGLFVSDNIDSFMAIPQRFTPKGSEAYIGLKVSGKSMSPLIDDGSIVVCERKESDWSAARDKIVVVKLEGQTRVKRVARDSSKDRIIFHSENEDFEDIIVAKPKISPLVRRVVLWWSFAK